MKILLVGKFPPMQGGISAKTFWLYRALKERGFRFGVVTFRDGVYSAKGEVEDFDRIEVVEEDPVPWHIPETPVLSDRLFQRAVDLSESFSPDLVEVNYLWPFCHPAVTLAKILKRPLVIRHAGSDLLKFKERPEFRDIIRGYFRLADGIVTNRDALESVQSMVNPPRKVVCLARYIPNPRFFCPEPEADKKFDLLLLGKANFHWRLKGLDLMLDLIRKRKLRTRMVIGGKGVKDFSAAVANHHIEDLVEISPFVHPHLVPALLRSASFVWGWEETETLDDFSNILWEAVFSGVPVIVNASRFGKIKAENSLMKFSSLIYPRTRENLPDLDFSPNISHMNSLSGQCSEAFTSYLSVQEEMYKSFLVPKPK